MAIRRTAGTASTRWPRRSCVIDDAAAADDDDDDASVSESLDELVLSATPTQHQ